MTAVHPLGTVGVEVGTDGPEEPDDPVDPVEPEE